MRIVLVSIGTAGDLHPLVGVGRALRERGHDVTLLANEHFGPTVERAGLAFHPIGTAANYRATIDNPLLFGDELKGIKVIWDHLGYPAIRPTFEYLQSVSREGSCVVAALMWAFGAKIAHEHLGLPLVTIHLQPSLLPTLHDMPTVPAWIPKVARRLGRRVIDRVFDGIVCPKLNEFRAELGLKPVRRVLSGLSHSPQRIIGLFPEWYGPPQPDWPPHARLTRFPLYDEADQQELPSEATAFLADGMPPIVFTPGSGMRHAHRFFAESADACRRLNRRGVLLTPFAEQIPDALPEGVRHFAYLPFSRVLPHSAALVHHGGIGTTSQALAAGIPQLITPYAFDQPDNAARIRRLGVGDSLRPKAYTTEAASQALGRLLSSSDVLGRGSKCAERIRGAPALDETCQLIEETG